MSKQIGLYLDPIMNPGGVQFPVKRGTWDFIEQSWMEGIKSSIISQIGESYDQTKVYVLYGCEYIYPDIFGSTTITAGALFYNGEVFLAPSASFSPAFPKSGIVVNLVSTSWQPTDANGDKYADPVNFIGSSPANIHIDRTAQFVAGSSGTGTLTGNTSSDYNNIFQSFSDVGLVFGSGCVNATGFYPVKYQIDKNKCFLSGAITGTSLSSTATILTLPSVVRPSSNVRLFAFTDGGISAFNLIKLSTSGALVFDSTGGLSGNIYLDGLNFQI